MIDVAVAALAYRVPQRRIETFLCDLREQLSGRGLTCSLGAVVDGEVDDLGRLAAVVDVLSYARERRGFGVARSTGLSAALLTGAAWIMLVDADGQHTPAALAQLVGEAGEADAIIPQRTLVALELEGAGVLNRRLDERFHARCVAAAVGRPDAEGRDLQPGMFLLRPTAARDLVAAIRGRGYTWDVEASYYLMRRGHRLDFPCIASAAAIVTSFTLDDARGIHEYLASEMGGSLVMEQLERLVLDPSLQSEFGTEALERYAAHVRQAVSLSARP